MKKIVVLKTDAIGDTMHSLPCIKEILSLHRDKEIFFFLSKRNKDIFNFIKKKNTKKLVFNYSLNFYEKIKIFFFFIKNDINEVYILAPKNLFYYLPFFFRNTKFYGICVNSVDNKFRPPIYLRKYLHKKQINDRRGCKNRKSIKRLQLNLINDQKSDLEKLEIPVNKNDFDFVDKYILFHFKKSIFDKLKWDLKRVVDFMDLLSNKYHVVLTTDIEGNDYIDSFLKLFNVYNFTDKSYLNKEKKITYLHNFSGLAIFDLIGNSCLTIGIHGLFTNVSSYLNIPTIDLFYIDSREPKDVKSYLDAAREFSPFNKKYFKIVPTEDYQKLKMKVKTFLKYAK